jgi:hypothetical protein
VRLRDMTPVKRTTSALFLALTLGAAAAPAYTAADPLPVDPFVPGAADDPSMVKAWQRWQAKGIDDYVITVRRTCYCPPEPAVRTVVRDDEVRRVTRGEKDLGPARGHSMDEMFSRISDATTDADRVEVDYTRRGIPRAITIDPVLGAADEETYYTVTLSRL